MLIAGVIAICILLAILGFLLPRLSDHARRGADKGFSTGARAGSKAPGPRPRALEIVRNLLARRRQEPFRRQEGALQVAAVSPGPSHLHQPRN